jgi:hypothetical protein
MLAKLLSAKVAALAAATVLGATGAAAATGNLPSPAQTALSDAAAHVGVSIPSGGGAGTTAAADGKPSGANGKPPAPNSAPPGPDAHADFGLCTAFLAAPAGAAPTSTTETTTTPGKDASAAFSRFIAAHGGTVASTTDYCHGVIAAHDAAHPVGATPDGAGNGAGTLNGPGTTNGHGPAAPGHGEGTGTGAHAHGATTAGNASGGASAEGSGNAGTHADSHRP